ncbi:MAG: hypothetical protein IJ220_07275 [Clostridia bacterium]|nr:hypothetical protein [Clostridia bacterium]
MNKLKEFILKNKERNILFVIITFLCINFFQFVMIELSASSTIDFVKSFFKIYTMIGYLTVLVINLIFLIVIKNMRISCLITTILSFLFSAINHLIFQFHGVPFTFSELANFNTAINVITPSMIIQMFIQRKWIVLAPIFVFTIIFTIIFTSLERINKKNIYKYYLSFVIIFIFLFCFYAFGIKNTILVWSWKDTVTRYGYIPTLVEETILEQNPILKPVNYSDNYVNKVIKDSSINAKTSGETPDIILILNETFYDVNEIMSVSGDNYWLNHFYHIPNSIIGKIVVPNEKGGTNISEYELLTSNSTSLIIGTPFNSLKFENPNSIIRFLKQYNYSFMSIHPAQPLNYKRNVVYPILGFERSYFKEDFTNLSYYGQRNYYATDESTYHNLINWYESMRRQS